MENKKSIIIRPYYTEASLKLAEKFNRYTFLVDKNANKIEIKKAIEERFKVDVVKVNTIRVKGKKRRVRGFEGKRPDYKKALVTVKEGQKIEFI